jgi:TonB family protein
MLCDFFGLQEDPFGVTPETRFLYPSRVHQEARASLAHSYQSNRGFVVLVGQAGMGKTTLLMDFLHKLKSSARIAFLFQTQCGPSEFLEQLMLEFSLGVRHESTAQLHDRLRSFLAKEHSAGKRVILVVDEAQNLDSSVLETVRLLSDFETQRTKLLHIVLSGQPQLTDKLLSPDLVQLRQRIGMVCRLSPLSATETREYIDHRLGVAGRHSGPHLFSDRAYEMIAGLSGGIPRNINNLCFHCLSLGYAMNRSVVDAEIVNEASSDVDLGNQLLVPSSQIAVQSSTVKSAVTEAEHKIFEVYIPEIGLDAPAQTNVAISELEPQTVEQGPVRVVAAPVIVAPAAVLAPLTAHAVPSAPPFAALSEPVPPALVPVQTIHKLQPISVPALAQVAFTAETPATPVVGSSALALAYKVAADCAAPAALVTDEVPPRPCSTQLLRSMATAIVEESPGPAHGNAFPEPDPETTESLATKIAALRESIVASFHSESVPRFANRAGTVIIIVVVLGACIAFWPSLAQFALSLTRPHSDSPLPDAVQAGPQEVTASARLAKQLRSKSPRAANRPKLYAVPIKPARNDSFTVQPLSAQSGDILAEGWFGPNSEVDDHSSLPASPEVNIANGLETPLLNISQPRYPQAAEATGIEGAVVLDATIDPTGKVTEVQPMSGNPQLASAAMDAVREWRYDPAAFGNNTRPVHRTVRIIFTIHGGAHN